MPAVLTAGILFTAKMGLVKHCSSAGLNHPKIVCYRHLISAVAYLDLCSKFYTKTDGNIQQIRI
ncbi:hypothetical protein GGQ60_003115 [Pedobacter zeae]|uniref:Uncharacterized protein n=1 Tax=Pedobacter zeae TaxID=1737356 RepID=A0A7W6KC68_9SPHI|nr:hypothetical protein [Pedobacter zeae]